MSKKRTYEGIEVRHERSCASKQGARCNCAPSYRAYVYSPLDERKLRKSFRSLAEARAWRSEALVAVRKGTMTAMPSTTLAEAAHAWVAGAESGSIRNRSGHVYKPSAVRGYEQALRLRVVPALGSAKLSDIRRSDLQALVDRLLDAGQDPSTIRNTLLPVRAIFRRALARGEVALNPTSGLELPAVRGTRDRIAGPEEAAALLAGLPADRAIWATAMYAGLRHGELRALLVEDIDLAGGVIWVERSWDPRVGPVAPKSRAGRRSVPIATSLRAILAEHLLALGWHKGLAFGRDVDVPFNSEPVNGRAYRAWKKAGLQRITLHECRHTFASLMIAAGVNAKALSTYMGHSTAARSEAARAADVDVRPALIVARCSRNPQSNHQGSTGTRTITRCLRPKRLPQGAQCPKRGGCVIERGEHISRVRQRFGTGFIRGSGISSNLRVGRGHFVGGHRRCRRRVKTDPLPPVEN